MIIEENLNAIGILSNIINKNISKLNEKFIKIFENKVFIRYSVRINLITFPILEL